MPTTALQAVALVAVAAAGAIPQLGFIHEDSGVSFALDIADLYREEIALPVAFGAVRDHEKRSDQPLERMVRQRAVTVFRREKVVTKMIDRIKELLDVDDRGGDE